MQGDDNNAFLSQSREYRLPDKVQLLTSIVDLNSIHAVGDAALGLVGSTRYMLHHRQSGEQGVRRAWQKEYGTVPDVFEGEQWQACQILQAGIEKAGSIEADKLRPALETVAIDSIKGHVAIRACDHQAVQQRLHGEGGEEGGLQDADPGDDRHLPGRRGHAGLPADDVRQLMEAPRPATAGSR